MEYIEGQYWPGQAEFLNSLNQKVCTTLVLLHFYFTRITTTYYFVFYSYAFYKIKAPRKGEPGIEIWRCVKHRHDKCPGRILLKRVGEKLYYVENSLIKHEGVNHDSDLDSDIIDIHRINVCSTTL